MNNTVNALHDGHDEMSSGPAYLETSHDKIPNFGLNPTITSMSNGSWDDPMAWSQNRIPTDMDIVSIKHKIVYNINSDARINTISVESGGQFIFAHMPTKLMVQNLLVLIGGYLELGTKEAPLLDKCEVVFIDESLLETDVDQYGNGLLVLGKISVYGKALTPYVRVNKEPLVGHSEFVFEEAVSNWAIGDSVYIPNTEHVKTGDTIRLKEEIRTIVSIAPDNKSIKLNAPLTYNHSGARDSAGTLMFLPHVANLTRNIVFKSENISGVRGHTMFLDRVDASVYYARFEDLGRTTSQPLHPKTNHIGRYAIHVHHVMGPQVIPENGFQFTFEGNSVYSANPISRWGLAMHGSHYGLIKNNLIVSVAGVGIMTEDGSESFNVIKGNFVSKVIGIDQRADARTGTNPLDLGFEGSAYWFRGCNNYVKNNIATQSFDGFVYFSQFPNPAKIPASQGQMPTVNLDINSIKLLQFESNEVYGQTRVAFSPWWIGTYWISPRTNDISIVKNFTVWHSGGISCYETNKFIYDNITVIGDKTKAYDNGNGLNFQDYMQNELVMKNINVQNMTGGIRTPSNPGLRDAFGTNKSLIKIENANLCNNMFNISLTDLWDNGSAQNYSASIVLIKDVKFGKLSNDTKNIITITGGSPGIANYIQWNTAFVINYNLDTTKHFKVYSPTQKPDVILPQSEGRILGSPEANLTNLQNWEKYGIARHGEICNATQTDPNILGFIEPITADQIVFQPIANRKIDVGQTITIKPLAFNPFERPLNLTLIGTNPQVSLLDGILTINGTVDSKFKVIIKGEDTIAQKQGVVSFDVIIGNPVVDPPVDPPVDPLVDLNYYCTHNDNLLSIINIKDKIFILEIQVNGNTPKFISQTFDLVNGKIIVHGLSNVSNITTLKIINTIEILST